MKTWIKICMFLPLVFGILPIVAASGEVLTMAHNYSLGSTYNTPILYGHCFVLNDYNSSNTAWYLGSMNKTSGDTSTRCALYDFVTKSRLTAWRAVSGVFVNFSADNYRLLYNKTYCFMCDNSGSSYNMKYSNAVSPLPTRHVNFTWGTANGSWTRATGAAHILGSFRIINTSIETLPYIINISAFNTSGSKVTTFDEREPITFKGGYFYPNGTPLSSGVCRFILDEGAILRNASDDSFSLCLSGCDTSQYIEGFTLPTPRNNKTIVSFNICYPQLTPLPVTLNISCAGDTQVITLQPEDIPSCAAPAFYEAITDTCASSASFSVSLVSSATSSPRRVLITSLDAGRTYSGLYINASYSGGVFAPSPYYHKVVTPGFTNLSFNCSSPEKIEAQMILSISDLPPRIAMEGLSNNAGFYPWERGNTTTAQYSEGNWSFFFPVWDTDLAFRQATLRNASGIVKTCNCSGNTPFNVSSENFLLFSANPWNISVFACDLAGSCVYASRLFRVNDTISPICSGFMDVAGDFGDQIPISATCYDEALFSLNITCGSVYSFGIQPIISSTYIFSDSLNVSESVDCDYRVCDAHTDRDITGKYKKKDIPGGFVFSTKGATHTFKSEDAISHKVITKKDRLSTSYTFDTKNKKSKHRFYYSAPSDSVQINSDLYDGWIVTPSSGVWFDAETDDPDAIVEVTRANGSFIIDVWTDKNNLTFNSIGLINCYDGSFHVGVIPPEEGVFSSFNCPDTTGSMMLFIFLLALDIVGAIAGVSMGAYGSVWGMVFLLFSGAGMFFLGMVMMGCFPVAGWIMLCLSVIVLGAGVFVKV